MSGPAIEDQLGVAPGGPVRRVRSLIDQKLGRCGTCIRLSLALAAVSWAAFAVLRALMPGSVPTRARAAPDGPPARNAGAQHTEPGGLDHLSDQEMVDGRTGEKRRGGSPDLRSVG